MKIENLFDRHLHHFFCIPSFLAGMLSQVAVDGKMIQPQGMIRSGFYEAHQALDLLHGLGISSCSITQASSSAIFSGTPMNSREANMVLCRVDSFGILPQSVVSF
ncbi:MAG TPA: hypothetical protein PKV33_06075 [Methanothrix sp.]|nr:hypothetical protein [Methanothrix sp.]